MNSGLYERAGVSATRSAAARANWFEVPFTKVSKVYRGFIPSADNDSDIGDAKGPVASGVSRELNGSTTVSSGCSWLGLSSTSSCISRAPTSSNASRTSGRYRVSSFSLTWVLGTNRRRARSPLAWTVTSWKVEYHTASDTWARSSCAAAVHRSAGSITRSSVRNSRSSSTRSSTGVDNGTGSDGVTHHSTAIRGPRQDEGDLLMGPSGPRKGPGCHHRAAPLAWPDGPPAPAV